MLFNIMVTLVTVSCEALCFLVCLCVNIQVGNKMKWDV